MRTLLFNPGPTNVHPDVRRALLTRDMSHREPSFATVLTRVIERMVKVLGGEGTHSCVPFVASGTGANEAVLAAVHGKLLVAVAGKYSERIVSIAERLRIPLRRVDFPPLDGVSVDRLEEALRHDAEITHVFVVHHETTTGVVAPLREIGGLAARRGVLLLTDAISSIGGEPFDLARDRVAFGTVSSNKGLESLPGLAFVIGRTEEVQKLKDRSRSFYFDLYAQWERCRAGGEPRFTAAVQLFFAMDAALDRLVAEGYENRGRRYRDLKHRLVRGLEALGLRPVPVPAGRQSNTVALLYLPPGVSYGPLRDAMRERGITIQSDADIVRRGMFALATLGALTADDVEYFLGHFEAALRDLGQRAPGAGTAGTGGAEAAAPATRRREVVGVILVAGLGRRLEPLTSDRPKCLVPVGGRPILAHILSSLHANGVQDVVLVVGYRAEQVRRFVAERCPFVTPRFVTNSAYATTGTAESLRLGLDAVEAGRPALVLEGDVVFEPALLADFLATRPAAATVAARYRPELTGTFVTIDGRGIVTDWVHERQRPPAFALEHALKTVNITYLAADDVPAVLRPALEACLRADGRQAPLEFAMRCAIRDRKLAVEAFEPGRRRWFEIDTPEDLRIAEALFADGQPEAEA